MLVEESSQGGAPTADDFLRTSGKPGKTQSPHPLAGRYWDWGKLDKGKG